MFFMLVFLFLHVHTRKAASLFVIIASFPKLIDTTELVLAFVVLLFSWVLVFLH